MDKKLIQEKRMRGYFLESAKNLLKSEGLKSISVRHVANKAGYSYATLYNYFKDINDLIFYCVEDFQKEAEEIIARKTKKERQGKNKIKAIAKAYVEYFVEYPGVFELFFLERMGNIGNKQETSEVIYRFLDKLCASEWEYCIAQGEINEAEADRMKSSLRFLTVGMLLFFENRLQPESYQDFMTQVTTKIAEIVN